MYFYKEWDNSSYSSRRWIREGNWKIEKQEKITVLVIELFDKISVEEQRALFEEGYHLLNFIHPEKDGKIITINKEEVC